MFELRTLWLPCLAWLMPWSMSVHALEGMWRPQSATSIAAQASALDLPIDTKLLANPESAPLGAIVNFGTCTGTLVSPDGLILTNQHCLLGSLQVASTNDRNLVQDGFLARTRAEEIPIDPNLRATLLLDRIDATRGILRGAQRAKGRRRFEQVDRIGKSMVDHCERDPDLRCDLSVFDGGGRFELLRQFELRDIRLVWVPPADAANFGGEFDNWMWPRHAADVALVRAYVAPDGRAETHDAGNVPYRSRQWLRTSARGIVDGESIWLAGFPSRTSRNRTASELANVIEWQYPRSIRAMNEVMDVIDAAAKETPGIGLKYSAMHQSIANYEKNFRGQLAGFIERDSLRLKQEEEARFRAWITGDGERERRYGEDVAALDAHLARWRARRERDFVHSTVLVSGGAVAQGLGLARDLYRLSLARERPDHRRDSGFQERDEFKFAARVQAFDKRFDLEVDQRLFEVWLARYLALPQDDRIPEFERWLGNASDHPEATVETFRDRIDALFRDTRVTERSTRERWLSATSDDLIDDDDPMMQLAVALFPALQRFEIEFKHWNGDDARYRSAYLGAYKAFRKAEGRPYYPDANGSLRVTLGRIMGQPAVPATDLPWLTTMDGLLAKRTGESPFAYPDNMLALARARGFGAYGLPGTPSRLPINFLSDLDIAGGNSGSPTINARGELVGVAFDTTWETVPSNWVFDADRARTIHVDARYWLWLLDHVFRADALLREMGITPTSGKGPVETEATARESPLPEPESDDDSL